METTQLLRPFEKKKGDMLAGEIKIRGGPLGSKEIIESDGREIDVDILAAQLLPRLRFPTDEGPRLHTKCSPYVVVRWNEREIGRSVPMYHCTDPVWPRLRFRCEVPLLEGMENSLEGCKLEFIVYSAALLPAQIMRERIVFGHEEDGGDTYLGSVKLEGKMLARYIGRESAPTSTRWIDLSDLEGTSRVPTQVR
jgi:hypothetical protein